MPAKGGSTFISAIPRRRAIGRMRAEGVHPEIATAIVDATLDILGEPDEEMLAAGAAELALALPLPPATKRAAQRALARVIWCAMLHRART